MSRRGNSWKCWRHNGEDPDEIDGRRGSDPGGAAGGAGPAGAMTTDPKLLRREWASVEGWRGTGTGMWAWLLQRAAALALVAVIVMHLRNPFLRPVQGLLLALVLLHGLLGLRAILLDFGLPVRLHRLLFVAAIVLSGALFAGFWMWKWY